METKKIQELYNKLHDAMVELREGIADTINSTPPLPGVQPIEGAGVKAHTVSFSTIANNNFILSPDYYSQEKQNSLVCDYVLKKDLSLDAMRERIEKLLQKKAVVVSGTSYPLNNHTLATLAALQTELN